MSSRHTAKRDLISLSEEHNYSSDSKSAEDMVINAKWDQAEVFGLEDDDLVNDDGASARGR